jgi:hypothetical protein
MSEPDGYRSLPARKDDDLDSSSPPLLFSSLSLGYKFLFYLFGIPSVIVIVLCAYIGLILYFFVAFLILSTLILSLFSYSLSSWSDLTIHILLWISWMPIFELFLSFCFEALGSFFFHVREFISLNSLIRYLEKLFEPNPTSFIKFRIDFNRRWFVWFRVILLGLLLLACLTAIIQGLFSRSSVFLYILCAYSAIPPISAFFHVLLAPWLDFFQKKPRPTHRNFHSFSRSCCRAWKWG